MVLKTSKQSNEWLTQDNFYSTWDAQILENFVKNIIRDFPLDIQETINTHNSEFNHLDI
jgi:hypothetical protein